MAYPLLCSGGYPVPEKQGMMEIVGICAVPTAVGSAMEVTLRDGWDKDKDTWGNDPEYNKHEVISFKSDGNTPVMQMFPSSIKVRQGLRAVTLTNATRVIVYVR